MSASGSAPATPVGQLGNSSAPHQSPLHNPTTPSGQPSTPAHHHGSPQLPPPPIESPNQPPLQLPSLPTPGTPVSNGSGNMTEPPHPPSMQQPGMVGGPLDERQLGNTTPVSSMQALPPPPPSSIANAPQPHQQQPPQLPPAMPPMHPQEPGPGMGPGGGGPPMMPMQKVPTPGPPTPGGMAGPPPPPGMMGGYGQGPPPLPPHSGSPMPPHQQQLMHHPGQGPPPPPPMHGGQLPPHGPPPPHQNNSKNMSMDSQYMQQSSQIFVFNTNLANQAAESVRAGQQPSLIAFHCAQPATKSFLDQHGLKTSQFLNRPHSTWLQQAAVRKGFGGGRPAPNGPQQHQFGPPPFGNQMPMRGPPPFGPGPPPPHQQPGNMPQGPPPPNWGPDNGPGGWDPSFSHGPPPPGGQRWPGPGPCGPPPPGSAMGPGSFMPPGANNSFGGPPNSGPGYPPNQFGCNPGSNNMLPMHPGSANVSDENLTPQQRQHREEKLAVLSKMQHELQPYLNDGQQPPPPPNLEGCGPGGDQSMINTPGSMPPSGGSGPPGGWMTHSGGPPFDPMRKTMVSPSVPSPRMGANLPPPAYRANGPMSSPHPASPSSMQSPRGMHHRMPYSSPGTPQNDVSCSPKPQTITSGGRSRGSNPSNSDKGGKDQLCKQEPGAKSHLNNSSCPSPLTSVKNEPQLMPVPSPQHIQYLNNFDAQELTIQKQPNTSLRDSDLISPAELDLNFAGNDFQTPMPPYQPDGGGNMRYNNSMMDGGGTMNNGMPNQPPPPFDPMHGPPGGDMHGNMMRGGGPNGPRFNGPPMQQMQRMPFDGPPPNRMPMNENGHMMRPPGPHFGGMDPGPNPHGPPQNFPPPDNTRFGNPMMDGSGMGNNGQPPFDMSDMHDNSMTGGNMAMRGPSHRFNGPPGMQQRMPFDGPPSRMPMNENGHPHMMRPGGPGPPFVMEGPVPHGPGSYGPRGGPPPDFMGGGPRMRHGPPFPNGPPQMMNDNFGPPHNAPMMGNAGNPHNPMMPLEHPNFGNPMPTSSGSDTVSSTHLASLQKMTLPFDDAVRGPPSGNKMSDMNSRMLGQPGMGPGPGPQPNNGPPGPHMGGGPRQPFDPLSSMAAMGDSSQGPGMAGPGPMMNNSMAMQGSGNGQGSMNFSTSMPSMHNPQMPPCSNPNGPNMHQPNNNYAPNMLGPNQNYGNMMHNQPGPMSSMSPKLGQNPRMPSPGPYQQQGPPPHGGMIRGNFPPGMQQQPQPHPQPHPNMPMPPHMMQQNPNAPPHNRFGAPNIQVKPNAPNTIQYLPNRHAMPQQQAQKPPTPNLDFLRHPGGPLPNDKRAPAPMPGYYPNAR